MTDISDICEFIWEIEDKYKLFDKRIDSVYFWELLRFRLVQHLYSSINNKPLSFKQSNKRDVKQWLAFTNHLLRSVYNSYLFGTLMNKKQVDILIFEHPRKKKYEGSYVDVYTNEFINKCVQNNDNFEIIEGAFHGRHYSKHSSIRSYLDHYYLLNIFQRLNNKLSRNRNVKFLNKDFVLLRQLQEEIINRFHINLKLSSLVVNHISQFKLEHNFYDELLKIKKPKKVYMVVGYGNKPLLSSCKKNRVEVIEFQHGVLSRYNLAYSYPLNQNIHYFPDKLYLFGKYWSQTTPLPKKLKIEYTGFPYLKNIIKKVSINKIKNQVLFISQLPVQNQLIEIAYYFAKKFHFYDTIFKFHPNERIRRESRIIMEKAKGMVNFTSITNIQTDIYDLLSSAEFVVGVFSTSIYEAIAFKCKPILIHLQGIENMEYLISLKCAGVAKDEDDIFRLIKNHTFVPMDSRSLFML